MSSLRLTGLFLVATCISVALFQISIPSASAVDARPFSPTSFWNAPLPAVTPTDANSATYVANIQTQIQKYYGTVGINTTSYSAPVYTVDANVAPVAVKFNNCQNKTWVDPNFLAQISAVPIPDDAVPSLGSDAEMVVWQPSTDTVWELWQAQKRTDGWYACWGGKITNASTSQGVFTGGYGVAASGLSLLGGMMRIDELQAGEINHTIDMSLVEIRRSAYSWPATRTDGWINDPLAIAEGQRFRLDPTLDVNSLNISTYAKMVARAAQKYGIVIRDKAGAVMLYAENPLPLINKGITNPYPALFNNKPAYAVMNNFPWNRLQALPFDYGKGETQPPAATQPPGTTQPAQISGYRTVTKNGEVTAFGVSPNRGSASASNVVDITATTSRNGYWLTSSDGKVFSFGDATSHGSMTGKKLNSPVVAMAGQSRGDGYYLLGADGGVFSFGSAPFYGSTGGAKLNRPVVGMATAPSGSGYWFVASDGGIFAYGPGAQFYGSMGGARLNKPIVGMAATPTGRGYWLVASDGGIFAFGDAQFYGSTGNITLNSPIVGMEATPTGRGYRFIASDGGIFSFGDATFEGSLGGRNLKAPVVGLAN